MHKVKSICVYCGSSNSTKEIYKEAAKDTGKFIAQNGYKLVYGGGQVGLMGITADATLEEGGYVLGFMTRLLDKYEGGHSGISELHIVDSMHERKQKMFEHSDAFIILPGGFGTLDEVFELLTWKQIGLHEKGIYFLNINNYWRPLFDLFVDHMIENGFVRQSDRNLYMIVDSIKDLGAALEKTPAPNGDILSKWV
jgi:hypothetical protein